MEMESSILEGDLTGAPADAICTSTNPRRDGKRLAPGSVHATTAGALPYKIAIHCVASNDVHLTSNTIIQACVRSALACAEDHGCTSVVMPVLATGHGRLKFDQALEAIFRSATAPARGHVPEVVLGTVVAPDEEDNGDENA